MSVSDFVLKRQLFADIMLIAALIVVAGSRTSLDAVGIRPTDLKGERLLTFIYLSAVAYNV